MTMVPNDGWPFSEQNGAWEALLHPLNLHESYRRLFQGAVHSTLYGEAPLSVPHRHFIALMASCRHRCSFLMHLHKSEFLRTGGDVSWLENLESRSHKIRDLDVLNRILAHQPWLLQTFHLRQLTQSESPRNWSLSELVHAAVILSHSHAVCSFVHAVGITSTAEAGCTRTETDANSSPKLFTNGSSSSNKCDNADDVETLITTMEELRNSCSERSQEEKQKQFFDMNIQNSEITSIDQSNNGAASLEECSKITERLDFSYVDFAKRDEASSTPTFKIHDYSWEDEGYSVISQWCSQLSNIVEEKFHVAQNLTYYTMGQHNGIDTSKYRTAVWNYIQSLYGIRHDDYDYGEVNKLLSRQMKTFVKTACCFPERITDSLRSGVMVDFHHSEKVHVCMMILEARFQAAMLYFLRAVMRFMT